MRFNS